MVECGDCGKSFKSNAGLGSHRRAQHTGEQVGRVEAATLRDLVGVDGSEGLQQTAVALAARIDETQSARDLPALAAELRQTLLALGVRVTEEKRTDLVDELAAKRRADVAASKDSARAAKGQGSGGP